MKRAVLICALLSVTIASYGQKKVSKIDVAKVTSRAISSTGFGLSKEFIEAISYPSEYMSDFFGVQILKNRDKGKMIKELKPYQVTDSTLILKFASGRAILSYDTQLEILGYNFNNNHIYFEGDDYNTFLSVKRDFYSYLERNNLTKRYLLYNPFYPQELRAAEQVNKQNNREILSYTKPLFDSLENAVLIYPDRQHGHLAKFKRFLSFVENANFDWLAIEMLNQDMTSLANDYIFAKEDSKKYKDAKSKIEEFYSTSWITHFDKRGEKYDKNPFIELFDLMRKRGKPIYGIENSSLMYIFFRYGETPFGAAVRNVDWANALPSKGRGVVFGGSSHFTNTKPVNFQNFVGEKYKILYYHH